MRAAVQRGRALLPAHKDVAEVRSRNCSPVDRVGPCLAVVLSDGQGMPRLDQAPPAVATLPSLRLVLPALALRVPVDRLRNRDGVPRVPTKPSGDSEGLPLARGLACAWCCASCCCFLRVSSDAPQYAARWPEVAHMKHAPARCSSTSRGSVRTSSKRAAKTVRASGPPAFARPCARSRSGSTSRPETQPAWHVPLKPSRNRCPSGKAPRPTAGRSAPKDRRGSRSGLARAWSRA